MHVLARVSNVKTSPEELMKNASTSGLVRYLTKSTFVLDLTRYRPIKTIARTIANTKTKIKTLT